MVRVDMKRVLTTLVALDLTFVILYLLTVRSTALPSLFLTWLDMDAEGTLPSWYSTAKLLALALLAAARSSQFRESDPSGSGRFYALLALLLLFFSIDESISIHENVRRMGFALGIEVVSTLGRMTWIYAYTLIGVGLVLAFRRGFLNFLQEPTARTALMVGATVFVGGAVVVESIGFQLQRAWPPPSMAMDIEIALEEGLELIGESLMLYALLRKTGTFAISFG